MQNNDTIQLLKECDSGTKMAVASIDEVSEKISNPQLKQLLQKSKEKHTLLGNELPAGIRQRRKRPRSHGKRHVLD